MRAPLALRLVPVAVGAVAVPLYWRLSLTQFINADDANTILQGYAMTHGNPLLRGWTVSPSPFYLIELPLFGLVSLFTGPTAATAHWGSPVLYVVLMAATGVFAAGRLKASSSIPGATMAVLLMAAPAGFVLRFLLVFPYHVGTALAVVLALLVVERVTGRRRDLLIWLILSAAGLSDPLALVAGSLAFAAVGVARLVARRGPAGDEAWLLGAVLASIPAAEVGRAAIGAAGGFVSVPLPLQLATGSDLRLHASFAAHGLLMLFGADPRSPDQGIPQPWPLLHLAVLLLLAAAVIAGLARRPELAARPVLQLAAAVVVVDIAATIANAQTLDIGSLRYLTPAYAVSAGLAGRLIAENVRPRSAVGMAAALAAMQAVFLVSVDIRQPIAPVPRAALENYLEAHGLHSGLAGYWDASPVTVDTDGQVAVRAVLTQNGQVVPYHWESEASWFRPGGARQDDTFVLVPEQGATIDLATLLKVFGPPAWTTNVAGYQVAVWHRDLRSQLAD